MHLIRQRTLRKKWSFPLRISSVNVTKCAAEACNFTKINTPPWVFFMFFKLYKCYQMLNFCCMVVVSNHFRKRLLSRGLHIFLTIRWDLEVVLVKIKISLKNLEVKLTKISEIILRFCNSSVLSTSEKKHCAIKGCNKFTVFQILTANSHSIQRKCL